MTTQFRANVHDQLVAGLIGPGKAFELETADVRGHPQQVFKGAPRNLAGLYRQAMAFGEQTMVVQDGRSMSFAEGFARAAALAQALREQFGVTRGTPVAVVTSNRIEWIVALLAITGAGGIAALINSRGVAAEMARAIGTAGCGLVIAEAACDDVLTAADPDPAWRRIVLGAPQVPLRAGSDADFEALSAPQPGLGFQPLDMDPEAGGVVLFTSGTTGFPKGALLSHGALAGSAALSVFMGTLQDRRYELETGEPLPPEARAMTTPVVLLGPMFHLSGMVPVFRALSIGTPIHIMTRWNAEVAFDMLEEIGMTRLSFVPAMLWDMFASPRATPATLSAVRFMMNGAAPLEPRLVAEVGRRMPKCLIATTYGQTEATAFISSACGQAYLDNPDTVGYPCPTVRVMVRRADGSEAGIDEPGEIWVSSALVMNGYVGNPEATAETLVDGWLDTGDIGAFDAGGMLRIVDRKKNMIISGGENIYSAEVERVLAEMPGVREAIAFGVPDARLGERLVACLVLADGAALDGDAVKAHCREHLALYKVPRDVSFRAEPLPRTASGKVDRGRFIAEASG